MNDKGITRRQFLKKSGVTTTAAIGFPYIVASSALGKAGTTAPSNRITLGFIGMGKEGREYLLREFLNASGTEVVAVCDVDTLRWKKAQQRIERFYSDRRTKGTFKGCVGYRDFREVLARDDIDAVVIATPEHWHAVPVIQAARAGKNIYCEKPLSLTIAQGRAMVNAVRKYNRILQTGSMQRSDYMFRFTCELVRNGYIGQLKAVTVNVGGPSGECDLPAEPEPDYLDWDMWLGAAPARPFNSVMSPHVSLETYVPLHQMYIYGTQWNQWRKYRDYSGGNMTDMGAHHFDIVQWALDMDDSGPVEIILDGNYPKGRWFEGTFQSVDKNYRVLTYKYANGVTVTRDLVMGLKDPFGRGILFEGTEGKIHVSRGYLRTWPDSLARVKIGPNEIHLYESKNHFTNWLDCIRTGNKPICDVEIGCRSAAVCHLGNIAYQLDRSLKWDPEQEVFVNDPEANRLLSRPMRSPWHL